VLGTALVIALRAFRAAAPAAAEAPVTAEPAYYEAA
jgi:hypothetical protein